MSCGVSAVPDTEVPPTPAPPNPPPPIVVLPSGWAWNSVVPTT